MMSRLLCFFLLISLNSWPGSGRPSESVKETSLALSTNPADAQSIRILIQKDRPEIIVASASAYRLFDSKGKLLMKGPRIQATRAFASERGIQLGAQLFRDSSLALKSEGDAIQVGERSYRDAVILHKNEAGRLDVINEVEVESYVKGVLPKEVDPVWPAESLKAQAVAARTYAVFHLLLNQTEPYHLSATVFSQVYGGKNSESAATSQAVEATEGQILVYRGKIFPAYFHSACGGGTARAEQVWRARPHPSLTEVECTFCRGSKHYRWEWAVPEARLRAALKKKGFSFGEIDSIETAAVDRFGRAGFFIFSGRGQEAKVQANDFRLLMDPFRFRSTLLTSIEKQGDQFIFRGRGWGHGVGLCQWGMKQLGELGYDYKSILKYYYPEAEVIRYS